MGAEQRQIVFAAQDIGDELVIVGTGGGDNTRAGSLGEKITGGFKGWSEIARVQKRLDAPIQLIRCCLRRHQGRTQRQYAQPPAPCPPDCIHA